MHKIPFRVLPSYCLARDIRGIGFLSADTIAQKVGIARDSPLRARAGISYALTEASGDGHCGLPRVRLIELAVKLLEIPTPTVEAAINAELGDEVLIADTIEGVIVDHKLRRSTSGWAPSCAVGVTLAALHKHARLSVIGHR